MNKKFRSILVILTIFVVLAISINSASAFLFNIFGNEYQTQIDNTLDAYDMDRDRAINLYEWVSSNPAQRNEHDFATWDSNNDGFLDEGELNNMFNVASGFENVTITEECDMNHVVFTQEKFTNGDFRNPSNNGWGLHDSMVMIGPNPGGFW